MTSTSGQPSPPRNRALLGRAMGSVGGEGGLDQGELAGQGLETGPAGDGLVLREEHDLQVAYEPGQQLEQQRDDRRLELIERLVEQHRRAGGGGRWGGGGVGGEGPGPRPGGG